MYGWFNSRFATPPDRFSEQHDHTLKLIASQLEASDVANLAMVNRRVNSTLSEPRNRVDVLLGILREKYEEESVQEMLAEKDKAVGNSMTLEEYLTKIVQWDEYTDTHTVNPWRIPDIYLTPIALRVVGMPVYITQNQLLEFALANADKLLSADGQLFDEPLAQTFQHDPVWALLSALVWTRLKREGRKFIIVPACSLRICKLFFDELGKGPTGTAVCVGAVASAIAQAWRVSEAENPRGLRHAPAIMADILVTPVEEFFNTPYYSRFLEMDETQSWHIGDRISEDILDRVDFIMTPEIAAALLPGDIQEMRRVYAHFYRRSPV
jgi:hypothetical protein